MNLKRVSSPSKFLFSKNVGIFLLLAVVLFLLVSKRVVSYETSAPLATQDINRDFSFPLNDSHGGEIGSIQYTIEKAELRDEIIVKGSRAAAAPGRAFIVLSIKITNDFKQAVSVNTKDYVRLSVNGDTSEVVAPEIHNDPVEVQAISTKSTKVGFPVNTNDKEISLWVGELNAEKERIDLSI